MTRNQLLCRLLGPDRAGLPPTESFEAVIEADDVVLGALCLARAGEVRRFEAVLPAVDADGIAVLARCCLMLGLAGDWKVPSLLFDALRQSRPGSASLWRDLALLNAAWGFPAQALRSLALANALDGGGVPTGTITVPVDEGRGNPGIIHFLPGNEKRFFPT